VQWQAGTYKPIQLNEIISDIKKPSAMVREEISGWKIASYTLITGKQRLILSGMTIIS